MRGYGLPRELDVEYPDKWDIRWYGLSSRHKYRYRGKPKTRRLWKKRQRQLDKRCLEQKGY